MERIGNGEWDDSIESELGDAIAEAIDDFGADFDAEGNPIEEGESDRIRSEEEREREARTEEGRASAEEESEDEESEGDRGQTPEGSDPSEEREQETAKA
jgi:F-type H+-transporting ATPase subunit alpha